MSYGIKKSKLNYIKNFKLKNHFKTKTLNFFFSKKNNFNSLMFYFYVPIFWNFILIKFQKINNYNLIFFYSSFYYINFFYSNNYNVFFFNNKLKIFKINFFFNKNFYKIYWILFKNLIFSFNFFFFKKIRFRGKGYYIFKNFRNSLIFHFGFSHKLIQFLPSLFLKFLSKTTILVFGLNKFDLIFKSNKIKKIKKINIFTLKGIRFTKQIIYKKIGKISSYR